LFITLNTDLQQIPDFADLVEALLQNAWSVCRMSKDVLKDGKRKLRPRHIGGLGESDPAALRAEARVRSVEDFVTMLDICSKDHLSGIGESDL
jgi:hypothetical protein